MSIWNPFQKDRDLQQIEQLYRQYREPLWRYAYKLLHDEHLAQDVVQSVFIKAIEKSHGSPFFKSAQTTKKCLFDKKVLKRQFEKCSNDNSYKTLYFNRKSFCNIWYDEWHLLPLREDKDNKFKFI